MAVYFCVLAGVLLNCIIYELNKEKKNAKKWLFLITTILLVFVSGFRYMVGTDYPTYKGLYDTYKTQKISIWDQPALYIIARISAIIYDDYATWFFIMAAITISVIMIGIYKNGFSFWFSILLYIFLGCWHESFNIVKQYAGAALLFLGYGNISRGKFLNWMWYCLLAMTFHISALLMIPVYFLVRAKNINIMHCLMMGLIIVFLSTITDNLFDLISELKQNVGVTDKESGIATGTVKWQRILVAGAPILFFLIFSSNYKSETDKNFVVLFYLSLLNFLLYLFFGFQSIYLSRFCIYTNIFNVLFIPYLIKPFRKGEKILIMFLIITLYFIFWVYDLMKVPELANFYWIWER